MQIHWEGVPTRGAYPTIPLAMTCHIMASSSHEARMEVARERNARILETVSAAAKECLSRILHLLPKSFSTVSNCALGTTALTIPSFQMSQPVAWIPEGVKG